MYQSHYISNQYMTKFISTGEGIITERSQSSAESN